MPNKIKQWWTADKWFNPVYRKWYRILMWSTPGIAFLAAVVITLLGAVFHASADAGLCVLYIMIAIFSAILGSAFTLVRVDNYERRRFGNKEGEVIHP